MNKRKFGEIRGKLFKSLVPGQRTLNDLAKRSGVNWKTTDRHITYLIGKGLVREVLSTPYVRIYELSDKGKAVARGPKERWKL